MLVRRPPDNINVLEEGKNQNVECVKRETSTTEEDFPSLIVGFYC